MLRKSISICQRQNKNHSFSVDLETCAACDRIDEKGIYSQPIGFQTCMPGKTKFAKKHVKRHRGNTFLWARCSILPVRGKTLTQRKHELPVSQRFVFSRVICSPRHWALVVCVSQSPSRRTIQCYVFPIYRAGFKYELVGV